MALTGADLPLTYVATSLMDRKYAWQALNGACTQARQSEVVLLTRATAVRSSPFHGASITFSRLHRALSRRGFTYVVTVVNPLLGFTGASFMAAGYRPFALLPITYSYDEEGMYVTRRSDAGFAAQMLNTPPSMMLVAGLTKAARRDVLSIAAPQRIDEADYLAEEGIRALPLALRPTLQRYRAILERTWTAETAYPRTIAELDAYTPGDPRGQCGVTSAWLAQELQRQFDLQPLFCRGSLRFSDATVESVPDHCWLEIGSPQDPARVILDLTSDQAKGFSRSIVCDTARTLGRQGITYDSIERMPIGNLPTNPVWPRYELLSSRLPVSKIALTSEA
jgi:hypothetical protein